MEPGKRLPGKVAIITGGASGIGEATARLFAMHGASVVICDLQDELGSNVASEIVAAGGSAEYRHLDTRQEDQWTALVEAVEGKYGRIDVLCNVAGIGCWERVICPRFIARELSETFVACSGGCGCVGHECYGRRM